MSTTTSSSSPSREHFCSFISEFIDKSKKIIVESEDVLDYDAVELTLLLKSIGFQLQSLEFESKPDDDAKDIEIEITCKRSGMKSKLKMLTNNCTCPANDPAASNNNSFWEVQGIAPVSGTTKPQGLIQDTSCNLLPEITKKTNNLARTMLTILQQHYKADFDPKEAKLKQIDVKDVLERFQANTMDNLKANSESINCISPNNIIPDKTKQHCSTPLSANNITPIPSYEVNGSAVNLLPKIIADNQHQNNSHIENGEINLTTDTEKNFITISQTVESCVKFDVSNSVMNDDETMDHHLNPENEKEICLIESISEARKNLDDALLLLKCNVTREISPGSSILTVTPQNFKKKWQMKDSKKANDTAELMSLPLERPRTPTSRNLSVGPQNIRRHSVGGANDIKLSPGLPSARTVGSRPGTNLSVDYLKKRSPMNLLTGKKPDTPRPTFERKAYGIEASVVKKALSGSHLKSGSAAAAKPPISKTVPKAATNANGVKKSNK